MMYWTGLGCDVCGFGTVEDVDLFDPTKPCPDCGAIMTPPKIGACDQCGCPVYSDWKSWQCPGGSGGFGSCDGKVVLLK